MTLSRRRLLAAAASALAAPAPAARAQAYPARAVRVIVPYAPGGQTDVIARLLAQHLAEQLGRQFYVENLAGAAGNIGIGRAAQAAPDGYTLLTIDSISYLVNPYLYEKAPYVPLTDFEPVSLAVTTTQVLVVNPAFAARTVEELVALIKAEPGKYGYASAGRGTPGHLTGELFRLSLGVDMIHVPFNGGGPAVASTIAGHTSIAFVSPAAAVAQVADGKLRALAVASNARLASLPDVRTLAEAGHADVECNVWVGLLIPAGAPREIVALLHRVTGEIVALPDVRERLSALGFAPFAPAFDAMAGQLREESAKWARIVRATGIKAE
jgi:tripartite-type tricarboxylate transporter receptor subunit TctC